MLLDYIATCIVQHPSPFVPNWPQDLQNFNWWMQRRIKTSTCRNPSRDFHRPTDPKVQRLKRQWFYWLQRPSWHYPFNTLCIRCIRVRHAHEQLSETEPEQPLLFDKGCARNTLPHDSGRHHGRKMHLDITCPTRWMIWSKLFSFSRSQTDTGMWWKIWLGRRDLWCMNHTDN